MFSLKAACRVQRKETHVLLLDLCLLLGSEIVDDVEELPDLLGSLALDHVSDGLASNIARRNENVTREDWKRKWLGLQEGLDVEVVGSEDDLEEHLLVYGDELLVPFADIGGAFSGLVLVLVCIGRRERLATVVLAVLKNLWKGKECCCKATELGRKLSALLPSSRRSKKRWGEG